MTVTSTRNIEDTESIDGLTLSETDTETVFSQLDLINKFTLNNYLLKRAFTHLAGSLSRDRNSPLHVVDLGCGSGNQLMMISRLCGELGLKARFTGVDINPILLGRAHSKSGDDRAFDFMKADVLSGDFILPECDIVISSQFMYRFTDDGMHSFLGKNRARIAVGMIISEIRRDRIAALLFSLLGKTGRLHRVVVSDGLTALSKSWKRKELQMLLVNSGLFGSVIPENYLFRYALICR